MLLDGLILVNAEIQMLLQDVTCESALCEAGVKEGGGGRGVGAGAQATPTQVNSGKAPYKQMCLLDETTSWAGIRTGTAPATEPGIRPHRSFCAAQGEGVPLPPATVRN
jgi:hypothetical protein